MDYKKREGFVGLCTSRDRRPAVAALNTRAEELYEMPKNPEELAQDTTFRYAGAGF